MVDGITRRSPLSEDPWEKFLLGLSAQNNSESPKQLIFFFFLISGNLNHLTVVCFVMAAWWLRD